MPAKAPFLSFLKIIHFRRDIKREISAKEWADLTNFEGNAQGFRLVNKENYQGLKLTYATLGAFTKYPRASNIDSAGQIKKKPKEVWLSSVQ
jgi:dGTPase